MERGRDQLRVRRRGRDSLGGASRVHARMKYRDLGFACRRRPASPRRRLCVGDNGAPTDRADRLDLLRLRSIVSAETGGIAQQTGEGAGCNQRWRRSMGSGPAEGSQDAGTLRQEDVSVLLGCFSQPFSPPYPLLWPLRAQRQRQPLRHRSPSPTSVRSLE